MDVFLDETRTMMTGPAHAESARGGDPHIDEVQSAGNDMMTPVPTKYAQRVHLGMNRIMIGSGEKHSMTGRDECKMCLLIDGGQRLL